LIGIDFIIFAITVTHRDVQDQMTQCSLVKLPFF